MIRDRRPLINYQGIYQYIEKRFSNYLGWHIYYDVYDRCQGNYITVGLKASDGKKNITRHIQLEHREFVFDKIYELIGEAITDIKREIYSPINRINKLKRIKKLKEKRRNGRTNKNFICT